MQSKVWSFVESFCSKQEIRILTRFISIHSSVNTFKSWIPSFVSFFVESSSSGSTPRGREKKIFSLNHFRVEQIELDAKLQQNIFFVFPTRRWWTHQKNKQQKSRFDDIIDVLDVSEDGTRIRRGRGLAFFACGNDDLNQLVHHGYTS